MRTSLFLMMCHISTLSLLALQVLERYVVKRKLTLFILVILFVRKSSFINTVASSLGDSIQNLNIIGTTRDLVTSTLQQYPLFYLPSFKNLNFSLYDIL